MSMSNVSCYRPANFIIQELVPPVIYNSRGERAWELLDARALITLQALRDTFGPIFVNNWHAGGAYQESGLRTFDTKTGARYSQHKYGRAFDCKFTRVTPREVYEYILSNPDKFPLLTTLENIDATPTWLHFDTRNHGKEGIWVVNP